MRTIKAAEISGKIVSLINEADKELVVVSAYDDPAGEDKLFETLQKARDRGIEITFFVTPGVECSASLTELNVPVYYVEQLPSKMYLSEKRALLTSINAIGAPDRFHFDFAIETENPRELEEVKETYLPVIQKNVLHRIPRQKEAFIKEHFKNQLGEPCYNYDSFENSLPKKMRLFNAQFQKTFRRHNLIYNKKKNVISCSRFPFQWTNFEYSGTIKISFHPASDIDYKELRHECISEFNELFRNHKTYWSYPYDTIRIYGDEAAHGIDPDNINYQINYHCWLIKEVTKFLQSKEDVLFKTPLYQCSKQRVYC